MNAQQALAEDPLREDMLREEMALHYLLGDRAGVVQAFKRCVARLRDEVGAPPMEETVASARLFGRNAPRGGGAGVPGRARPSRS